MATLAALAIVLALASPSHAGKSDPIRVVSGSSAGEPNLAANLQYGNAKAREQLLSVRKVKGTGSNIDLAHGPRPLISAKDPRFDTATRELRETRFQIAPLK